MQVSLQLQTNTFQCVLATDYTTSYILFLYERGGIQWARGDQIISNLNSGPGKYDCLNLMYSIEIPKSYNIITYTCIINLKFQYIKVA